MQNKANVKIGKMNISAAIIKDYDKKQPRINDERYSKQTQTNPISIQKLTRLRWNRCLPAIRLAGWRGQ
jgi:hypothetical protein